MKSLISCCFLVSRRRDLVLDCDRGTKRAVVRAAYHREEGGDGPRRCTLPSISSFYRLSASWLNKPPTSPVFVSCETAPWYAHSAKSHERSERLSVSSKLTSLGSGLLLFFCFSVNTEIWQRASKRGAQFNWGREGSAKQVYFEMLLQVFRGGYLFFSSGKSMPVKVVCGQRTQTVTWKSPIFSVLLHLKLRLSLLTDKYVQSGLFLLSLHWRKGEVT